MEYRPPRAGSGGGARRPVPSDRRPRPAGQQRPRLADLRTERIAPERAPRRPAPPPPPQRPGLVAGRVALGLLSALVLAATGYYWQVADDFSDGLTTTDVIAGPTERPRTAPSTSS
ncbi:hypothetical protein ACFQV2_07145 [Actinokineospora soli]|uniref:Uncharacterized protein n=1 Tax=Actinokineospora soli TaxID=1048753 RepID=A0ABW2TLH1_9PSEU